MLKQVDYVMLPVQEMPRAVAFYRDTLGLPLISKDTESDWVEFQLGEVVLGLGRVVAFGMEFAPVTAGTVAFGVEDLDATRQALEAKGVAFEGGVYDTPVCRMTGFSDPDGNMLMIHHRHAPED